MPQGAWNLDDYRSNLEGQVLAIARVEALLARV